LSLRRYLRREAQLELVAVWSATETQVPAGVRLSASASSLPEVLKAAGPVFSADDSVEHTLLESVMAAEGVASWVTLPLRSGGEVVALLNISSVEPRAIDRSRQSFFEVIGRAVEPRVTTLLTEG